MTKDQYIVSAISAGWTAFCVFMGWALMKYTK